MIEKRLMPKNKVKKNEKSRRMEALKAIGSVCSATCYKSIKLPIFNNARFIAGFPLALDTDEQAQL